MGAGIYELSSCIVAGVGCWLENLVQCLSMKRLMDGWMDLWMGGGMDG